MSKNVLVISTSPRKGGNSDMLADEFMRGALEAGNQAEKITLYDKELNFCRGCLACQKIGRCVIRDDAAAIIEKMQRAEVIAFATPIYFYEMCGQMKTLLDRSNPLFPAEYAFRDIYFLSAAAEDEADTDSRAISGLEGWIACFDKARLAGTVFGGGADVVGAIKGNPALAQAYAMGKQC